MHNKTKFLKIIYVHYGLEYIVAMTQYDDDQYHLNYIDSSNFLLLPVPFQILQTKSTTETTNWRGWRNDSPMLKKCIRFSIQWTEWGKMKHLSSLMDPITIDGNSVLRTPDERSPAWQTQVANYWSNSIFEWTKSSLDFGIWSLTRDQELKRSLCLE